MELREALSEVVNGLNRDIPMALIKEFLTDDPKDEGEWEAVPQAMFSDISYTTPRRMVCQYDHIYDIVTEGNPDDYSNDELAEWMEGWLQESQLI